MNKRALIPVDLQYDFMPGGALAVAEGDQGVEEVFVCGLATDYCVKFTALDAAAEGFHTHVIADACRAVEMNPGDADRAIEEMQAAGVRIVTTDQAVVAVGA